MKMKNALEAISPRARGFPSPQKYLISGDEASQLNIYLVEWSSFSLGSSCVANVNKKLRKEAKNCLSGTAHDGASQEAAKVWQST